VVLAVGAGSGTVFWPWTKPQTSSFEGSFAVLLVEFVTLLIAAWPFLQRYAAADP
jgi:hypothetical protein